MASRRFGTTLRIGFVSALALWLSGCGLPPALTIATSAADGLAFIATGKSVSDLALSAMTEQDCAVYRVVTGKEVCRDARLDDSPGGIFVVHRGDEALTAPADQMARHGIRLDGFAADTELFALIQNDGALEVFAHEPHRTDDRSNMRLVVRVPAFAGASGSMAPIRLNGAEVSVADIIV